MDNNQRNPHLENMEGFELDVSGLFFQHVHHQLQVVWIGNVSSHHLKGTQKNNIEQLYADKSILFLTEKLCLSSRSSPRSFKDCLLVT